MNERDFKKVLMATLNREAELYDFCIECLKRIYGDESEKAIHKFEEGIQFHEYNGCIQSLCCIDSQLVHDKARAEEYRTEQLKKG